MLTMILSLQVSLKSAKVCVQQSMSNPGAVPGFPVGGHQPSLDGAPTSDTGAFQ